MDIDETFLFTYFTLIALTVILSVWLIKQASPEKRIYWFCGYTITAIFLCGIFSPIAIFTTLTMLAFLKKGQDNPLVDIRAGTLSIIYTSSGFALYGLYIFLGVGNIYWFWLAIQMKSFGMFILGCVPFLWVVTGPVGAYSLALKTPQWVINIFG